MNIEKFKGISKYIYVVIPLAKSNRCSNSEGKALPESAGKGAAAKAEAILI